jgi:hypothetical protein
MSKMPKTIHRPNRKKTKREVWRTPIQYLPKERSNKCTLHLTRSLTLGPKSASVGKSYSKYTKLQTREGRILD